MTKARANLVLDHTFFGSLALRLKMVEDPTCETMWTDGVSLGFNPEYVLKESPESLRTGIAHEVGHVLLAHHLRMQGRDHKKWNVAADHAVNHLLEGGGFRLSDNDLPGIDNSAEAIYVTLPDPPEGGEGDGGGNGTGDGQGTPGRGEVRPWPGPEGDGNPTKAETEAEEQNWKVAVTQAAQQAKAMGKLPAGAEQFIEAILQPRVPWTDVLRNFLEIAAKNDYNWTRPNRRYLQHGLVLPSLHSNELGEIVVAIDTSGSEWGMQDRFASELSGILENFPGVTVHIIYCDASVRKTETIDELPIELHPEGGGGTNFIPVFDHVEENGMSPTCLVYLTDMMGTFPEDEPDYPVIWVDTYGAYEPPFGEYVKMEDI
jgi:predicted metal-dependent peptidase